MSFVDKKLISTKSTTIYYFFLKTAMSKIILRWYFVCYFISFSIYISIFLKKYAALVAKKCR